LQWKYFIELPAQLEEPEKVSKTLLYDKNSNSFVESATVKNNTFQIEHMINQDLFKTVIDSSDFQNIKGISLEGKMTIRDKNNIPMVLVFLKKGDDWTQVQTDFVGMRIENINESSHFESDYVFPEDILSSDTLSIQFSNSHGLTTLENLKIQFVEK